MSDESGWLALWSGGVGNYTNLPAQLNLGGPLPRLASPASLEVYGYGCQSEPDRSIVRPFPPGVTLSITVEWTHAPPRATIT
jgi:hypothetical protein